MKKKGKKDSIDLGKAATSQESSLLLDPQKELQLIRQAQSGDVFARNVLIKSNMGIISTFAAKFHQTMEYNDAVQEAVIGFIKAINKFDVNKGCRLNTYAGWWTRQRISRSVPEATTPVVFPSHFLEKKKKVSSVESDLLQKFEKNEITPQIISERTGFSPECVKNIMNTPSSFSSMSTPIADDERCLEDVIPDNDFNIYSNIEKEELFSRLDEALSTLSPRVTNIMRDYYGLDNSPKFTFDEIGPRHDITRERARQLHLLGLKKLKAARGDELRRYISGEENDCFESSKNYNSNFFTKCSALGLDEALKTLTGSERLAISAYFGLDPKRNCLSIERVSELVKMPFRATVRLIRNAHHKLIAYNDKLNEVIPLDFEDINGFAS